MLGLGPPSRWDCARTCGTDHHCAALTAGSPLGGFCLRSADHESPAGEWTLLELITVGDRAVHVVNGHVVMVLDRLRAVGEDGTERPMTGGQIQLQSEAAEVFFKDVEIRPVDRMPPEYAAYFDAPTN